MKSENRKPKDVARFRQNAVLLFQEASELPQGPGVRTRGSAPVAATQPGSRVEAHKKISGRFGFRVSDFLRLSAFGFRLPSAGLSLLALVLALGTTCAAGTNTPFTRTEDVVYGRKHGLALTLDVFRPAQTNGCGVLFLVSGGWFSRHESINPAAYEAFLKRGYTVFAVVHGSQPKFQIPEIMQDMHRAVRFIRANAAKFGVDPRRLGVTGASAGGHLSLILGTQGHLGAADAKDPVDSVSSAVQAVACFFPPTDFLNYGKTNESALGEGILKDFRPAFGDVPTNTFLKEKFGRQISPIYHITSNLPPTLIIHGDADTLVPMQQAESFLTAAKKVGVPTRLVVKKGAGHGWPDWLADMETCAQWFDEHLRGLQP